MAEEGGDRVESEAVVDQGRRDTAPDPMPGRRHAFLATPAGIHVARPRAMYDNCTCIWEEPVSTISIRDLGRRPSQVIDEVIRTGRPAIITRHGRPVTAMVAVDPDELEDFVLAHAPAYVRSMHAADADLRAGRARPADEVFAEIDRG